MQKLYTTFLKSTGISTDTRKLAKGNLFFALSGPNFNGNLYAKIALDKGALAVIVDDRNHYIDNDSYYLVENSLGTLQNLASLHRSKLKAKVIGLTGSNGKTTTKELITTVLSQRYKTQSTLGNFNNHIGVPLTLLDCNLETEFLVLEMGANHQKEIAQLCSISDPDFGLITNIGKAHLEGFGGIEGVKKGKKEIYDYLSLHKKPIFIDESDETLNSLLSPISTDVIKYKKSDYIDISKDKFLKLRYKNKIINTLISGKYNIGNIATAVTIGEHFGVDLSKIVIAIEKYIPENNRSEFINIDGIQIFKDAYNANPTSMQLSLENFIQSHQADASMIIIGDMLELGEYSKEEHHSILKFLSKYEFETYLIGSEFYKFKNHYSKFRFYNSTNELKIDLNSLKGKTVFLKGSRGIGLEKLFI